MAIYECEVNKPFNELVKKVEDGILKGSMSATLEEQSNFSADGARCSVRVFERYSTLGQNRVSMSVTFFQNGDSPVFVSAITSGGSQAVFFKINTFGEDSFLEKIKDLLR